MTFEEFLSFGHRRLGEAAKSYALKFSRATVLRRYEEELDRLVRGTVAAEVTGLQIRS
jgi:hypothetical protein